MNLEKIVFKNDIDCFEVKGTNYNIECVQRYLKLEQNELQRMFIHSENLSQKYILWLKSELWFPLFSEEISVTFEFNNGVNINLPKYQIKTPYPNKSIKVACMKNRITSYNVCYTKLLRMFYYLYYTKHLLVDILNSMVA